MKFTSLGSSSKGNSYLLQADGVPPLLLEAGFPIKQLRNKLREHGIPLPDLSGVLVTHEHMDHAKGVKDLLKAGVDVWLSLGTAKELDVLGHHRMHIVFEEAFPIDGWQIKPFDLEHDVAEPKGFVISQGEDRLLFAPDTASIKERFAGLTQIAVEANFITDILNNNVLEGHIPACVGKRVHKTHMSIETFIAMLKANDLSRVQTIHLLHLSAGNSDEMRMRREVEQATGIPTYVCEE